MIKKVLKRVIEFIYPDFLYSRKSYSQDGEDLVLRAFFEPERKYKGFYVDIGAHHPYRFSNTAFFYKRGWRGINIEPTPNLIQAFKRVRKRDINLNIGISDSNSVLKFYEFNEPALNSFDKELSLSRENNTYKIISEKSIQTFTLSEILNRHMPKNQKIDFMNIDVEGLDLNVLKSNEWTKFSPNYILVEGKFDINEFYNDEINNYLKGEKYKIVGRTKRTFIFKHNDC